MNNLPVDFKDKLFIIQCVCRLAERPDLRSEILNAHDALAGRFEGTFVWDDDIDEQYFWPYATDATLLDLQTVESVAGDLERYLRKQGEVDAADAMRRLVITARNRPDAETRWKEAICRNAAALDKVLIRRTLH